LKPTFSPDELIEKTEITLGKTRLSRLSGKDEPIIEKPVNPPEEARTATAEDSQPVRPRGSIETKAVQEHELTGLSWQREDGKENQKERPMRTAPWSKAVGGIGRKGSLLPLVVGAAILLLIGGAVLVGYHPFTSARKVSPSPAVPPSSPVPSKAAEADSGPPLLQARNPAEASSSPSPPSQVAQVPSSSQDSVVRLPRMPFYSVQLGAFRNEGNALILRNKFREKGYDAFTQRGVTGDRSAIYRVLAGKYEDRKTAERLAGEIQLKEEIKTTLYKE
jgi:cell division septation protein DedD